MVPIVTESDSEIHARGTVKSRQLNFKITPHTWWSLCPKYVLVRYFTTLDAKSC